MVDIPGILGYTRTITRFRMVDKPGMLGYTRKFIRVGMLGIPELGFTEFFWFIGFRSVRFQALGFLRGGYGEITEDADRFDDTRQRKQRREIAHRARTATGTVRIDVRTRTGTLVAAVPVQLDIHESPEVDHRERLPGCRPCTHKPVDDRYG